MEVHYQLVDHNGDDAVVVDVHALSVHGLHLSRRKVALGRHSSLECAPISTLLGEFVANSHAYATGLSTRGLDPPPSSYGSYKYSVVCTYNTLCECGTHITP